MSDVDNGGDYASVGVYGISLYLPFRFVVNLRLLLDNGHEFKHTPGDVEGQGGLSCCSPWGCKESDTTEQLNNNKTVLKKLFFKTKLLSLYLVLK